MGDKITAIGWIGGGWTQKRGRHTGGVHSTNGLWRIKLEKWNWLVSNSNAAGGVVAHAVWRGLERVCNKREREARVRSEGVATGAKRLMGEIFEHELCSSLLFSNLRGHNHNVPHTWPQPLGNKVALLPLSIGNWNLFILIVRALNFAKSFPPGCVFFCLKGFCFQVNNLWTRRFSLKSFVKAIREMKNDIQVQRFETKERSDLHASSNADVFSDQTSPAETTTTVHCFMWHSPG